MRISSRRLGSNTSNDFVDMEAVVLMEERHMDAMGIPLAHRLKLASSLKEIQRKPMDQTPSRIGRRAKSSTAVRKKTR